MPEIIPTVVPKSLTDVVEAQKKYAPMSRTLHIDITDGIFTPEKTWTVQPGERLPDAANTFYEAHLMVLSPLQAGMMFARAGARRIIAHVESFNNAECAREAFDMWQKAGAEEWGVALKLDTPLEKMLHYAQLCDFVHVMTIGTIGKQGAPYDERALPRIAQLRARYPKLIISVDGGTNEKNIAELAKVGAQRFCVGSTLAKSKHPEDMYVRLQKAASQSVVAL